MAVFTKLNEIEIENFLETYNIGKLNSYNEIIDLPIWPNLKKKEQDYVILNIKKFFKK